MIAVRRSVRKRTIRRAILGHWRGCSARSQTNEQAAAQGRQST